MSLVLNSIVKTPSEPVVAPVFFPFIIAVAPGMGSPLVSNPAQLSFPFS